MPTLLAVIPHPDDESYSFGGTIALAARAGWRCVVLCASAGEKGKRHDGGASDPASVGAARCAELRESCRRLRAEAPVCWGLPDGDLRECGGQSPRVADAIREFGPEMVLTLGADGAYGHPDHIAVHRWVREAWVGTPEKRPALLFTAFPPGLFLPQYQKCIGMMGEPPDPPPGAIGADAWHYEVPISSVANVKSTAIAAHRSQLPDGDVNQLFPPGIVGALMAVERFVDARGAPDPAVAELLRGLSTAAGAT